MGELSRCGSQFLITLSVKKHYFPTDFYVNQWTVRDLQAELLETSADPGPTRMSTEYVHHRAISLGPTSAPLAVPHQFLRCLNSAFRPLPCAPRRLRLAWGHRAAPPASLSSGGRENRTRSGDHEVGHVFGGIAAAHGGRTLCGHAGLRLWRGTIRLCIRL
jgi:hypothetical protein